MSRRWRDRVAVIGMRGLRHVPRRIFWSATRIVFPTFTVGVVCVLLNERREVLLVQNPYNRGWTTPGGFLARGEQPREAALRELGEELGASGVELFDIGTDLRSGRRQVDFIFLAKLDTAGAERLSRRSPEIAELRWFPIDDLPDLHRDAQGFVRRLRLELTESNRFDACLPPDDLAALRRWASQAPGS